MPVSFICEITDVTQELIDETRLSTERKMLDDLQDMAAHRESLEFSGRNGETPVIF